MSDAKTCTFSPRQGFSDGFLGLNGRWGAGKSTLLNFVVEEIHQIYKLEKNDLFQIFEFNPWRFSGQEQLLWSFYDSLLNEIAKPNSRLLKYTESLASLLDESKYGKLIEAVTGEYSERIKKGLKHFIREGSLEQWFVLV